MIYSLFTAMIATGSILILLIFMRSERQGSLRSLRLWSILFIVSIVPLMFIHQAWLYAIVLVLMGFASQAFRTTNRILVQKWVEPKYRGSVLSISMMDKGFIPLGGILLSFIFEHLGLHVVYVTMIVGLILTLLCVLLMFTKEYDYGAH